MSYFFPARAITTGELLMVPEALFQLVSARCRVSFLKSSNYLRNTAITNEHFVSSEQIQTSKIIAGVINGLATRTPFASTCLVKVLAARRLLLRRNIPHTLHFGVNKKPAKELGAHAWLSVAGEILIGGREVADFKEISRF